MEVDYLGSKNSSQNDFNNKLVFIKVWGEYSQNYEIRVEVRGGGKYLFFFIRWDWIGELGRF